MTDQETNQTPLIFRVGVSVVEARRLRVCEVDGFDEEARHDDMCA